MGKEPLEIASEHNLSLEGRRKLTLSGVVDVQNFDETQVVLETSLGFLTVHGSEIHIEKLSLDNGQLQIIGEIESIEYDDHATVRGGLLSRIFG